MNTFQLLFYLIYLPVTVFITVRVGWLCYTNGEYYIKEIYQHQPELVKPINNLLLTGYYLLNIGYVVLILSKSATINSLSELFGALSLRIGVITITLGLIHYFNLFALAFFSRFFKNNKIIPKPLKN